MHCPGTQSILKILISKPWLEIGPMWVLREHKDAIEEGVEWAAMGRTEGNAVREATGPGNGEIGPRSLEVAWLLLRGRQRSIQGEF